jgi:2-aminoadipate transaminase
MSWTLARRAERLNPSTIREILKVTERPGIISLAGGLPSADTFPVAAMREATERVLRDTPREALQYAASEGYAPLREWVAGELSAHGIHADADRVLITTGSQQGLDLVGKVLIDPDSTVAVESPTYLGALQAFAPFEPRFVAVEGDSEGPLPEALDSAEGARFLYLLPNYQNPTGRCLGAARREAIVARAARLKLPIVEDNPYGDLWFDSPPRLGYVVAPAALYPKLLQAKQAADLHTPGFNQRVVHEVIKGGFLREHVPTIRARYKAQRDAMRNALEQHMAGLAQWNAPVGGMFFWLELAGGLDATALLPRAVQAGVAFVPGSTFFPQGGHANTLRLSFVTVPPERIAEGVAALARVIQEARA